MSYEVAPTVNDQGGGHARSPLPVRHPGPLAGWRAVRVPPPPATGCAGDAARTAAGSSHRTIGTPREPAGTAGYLFIRRKEGAMALTRKGSRRITPPAGRIRATGSAYPPGRCWTRRRPPRSARLAPEAGHPGSPRAPACSICPRGSHGPTDRVPAPGHIATGTPQGCPVSLNGVGGAPSQPTPRADPSRSTGEPLAHRRRGRAARTAPGVADSPHQRARTPADADRSHTLRTERRQDAAVESPSTDAEYHPFELTGPRVPMDSLTSFPKSMDSEKGSAGVARAWRRFARAHFRLDEFAVFAAVARFR